MPVHYLKDIIGRCDECGHISTDQVIAALRVNIAGPSRQCHHVAVVVLRYVGCDHGAALVGTLYHDATVAESSNDAVAPDEVALVGVGLSHILCEEASVVQHRDSSGAVG